MGTERKQALAEEIIALEDEYAVLHEQSQQTRERIGMIRRHSRSLIFRLLLGRRLPRELGNLWSSIEKGTDPLLGPELSAVLNSATRRILGYKRWILLFGFFAASPASISMLLLWQAGEMRFFGSSNSIRAICKEEPMKAMMKRCGRR